MSAGAGAAVGRPDASDSMDSGKQEKEQGGGSNPSKEVIHIYLSRV